MMKADKFDNNQNTYAKVNVKGQMVFLFVIQLLLMMLAFFATYSPVHAEENPVEETPSIVNDEKIVNTKKIAKTLGAFQNLKKTEKNEATAAANSNSYLLQLVSGLIIVLLSIVVLAWIAKRFNRMQSPGGGNLRIVEGISMGARERVVVVEVDGERLLLGVSPGRINMLHALTGDKPAENTIINESEQNNNEATFSQKIAAAMMKERS